MTKTAFFASDPIALDAIEFLRNSREFPLACVVSNPDRPQGRGRKIAPNEVSKWAIENGVELLRPEGGVGDDTVARLRELGVEMIIVMAYGCMLRDNVLNYGQYPCLNLHGSVLPKYRGASPIETAIAMGDSETGVSLMRIVKKMDAGAVCDIEKIAIDETDTAESLRLKFRRACPAILARNLESVKNKTAKFAEQDESAASYTRKFDKSDMYIDFSGSAESVRDRVRALGFGVLQYGEDAIKVRDASCENCGGGHPAGAILSASADGLAVACGNGAVVFKSLQKPCAKMMPAREFFAGYKMGIGEVLKSFPYKSLLK